MNKSQLVTAISVSTAISKAAVESVLDAFVSEVNQALRTGDSVAINNFGTFAVKERAAKTGRNPKTGEAVEVPARKAPAFKPAKALKDSVNN